MTSPSRKERSSPRCSGVPPRRPSCARSRSGGERLARRGGQGDGRFDLDGVALPIVGQQDQGAARPPVRLHPDRPREANLLAGEAGAQLAAERRVVRLPEALAGSDAPPVQIPVAKAQAGHAAGDPGAADLVDPAAFLPLFGPARIEDHAIARLERRRQSRG